MFSFSFHSPVKRRNSERQKDSLSSDDRRRWAMAREKEMRKLFLMTVAISSVYVSLSM
jgi:hypothetical protein